MTAGENDKKNEGKGFAGLASLVSDVDTTPPPPAKKEPAAAAPSAIHLAPQAAQPQPPPQPTQHQTHQAPAQSSSDSSGGKWLLGIIAVIGVIIWLVSHSDNTGTSTTPVYDPSKQVSNFDQDAASKEASESEPPKFSDYLSEPYDGPRASVNLASDFDKNFRTRIRGTQSQPVNFAGEYILSTWGCGMSCSMGVAVSSRTGRVVALPGTACCWKGEGERVIFKKNSRLLVLAGLINEGGKYGAHFYELKNDQFVHVKTIVVKEDDSGPASSAESAPQTYPSPSTSQQVPSRPTETKPPVGQNLVLSREQIRYCLAEGIRMDAAKSAVNNYIDADVDRFNAMVADYNSRCSSFQYQTNNRGRNDLNNAQRDIESFRSQLQSEGGSRFTRRSSTGALPLQAPSHPTAAPSVAVTPPTYTAPVQAQTGNGIPQNAHQNYLGNGWECNRGYYKASNECKPVQMPPNATLDAYGSGWVCQRGFYRAGSECLPVQMPRYATLDVYGSGWVCQRGYYKSGNECQPVQMPPNATLDVYGSGWVCQRGFYKAGNECLPVQMPKYATLDVYGSGWVCQRGYYRSGNNCQPVQIPQNATLDVYGSGWACVQGYVRVGDGCVAN